MKCTKNTTEAGLGNGENLGGKPVNLLLNQLLTLLHITTPYTQFAVQNKYCAAMHQLLAMIHMHTATTSTKIQYHHCSRKRVTIRICATKAGTVVKASITGCWSLVFHKIQATPTVKSNVTIGSKVFAHRGNFLVSTNPSSYDLAQLTHPITIVTKYTRLMTLCPYNFDW